MKLSESEALVAHFFLALKERDTDYFHLVTVAVEQYFKEKEYFRLFNVIRSALTQAEKDWIFEQLKGE